MKRVLLLICMLATVTSAQGWQRPDMQTGGRGPGMPPENMEAVRIWKMTEILELTEEQVTTFIPIVQIHERKIQKLQAQMNKEKRQLRANWDDEKFKQKDADAITEKFIKIQDDIHTTKVAFLKKLPEYLTPEQQVKYLFFEMQFRQDLREFIRNQRGGAPQRRR